MSPQSPLNDMKTFLSLLLIIQLTSAPLAQSPPAARASAHAEQMQQALQERTKLADQESGHRPHHAGAGFRRDCS